MNACLWCDDPCGSDKLCPPCAAINYGPVFRCDKPGHIPSLGTSCHECSEINAAAKRRAERNAPIIASLRELRAQHIRDWHVRWPGLEFAKAHFGQMIDGAIADLS